MSVRLFFVLATFATFALVASACGSSDSVTTPATGESAATATPASQPSDDAADAGDEAESEAESEPTPEPTPEPEPTAEPAPVAMVRAPVDVIDPDGTGLRIIQPISNGILPDSYTEREWIYGGQATAYQETGELTANGEWDAVEADTADYRTRMIVRLPADPADFSGVILVEWFNVTSGADTSPDWAFLNEEIEREGHGYIGVSAQSVGINGTEGDFIGGGLIDTSGLAARDPERYGELLHPGDAYAFDVFTQAGALIKGMADTDVLGGFEVDHMIALGESQSAGFMTTYANAIHPLVSVYDGFLVHSRGTFGPTPSGERLGDSAAVQHRTDLNVPLFVFEAETDVVGLGYFAARQDDSDNVVVWEVAGTAHADSYTLAQAIGVPPDETLGALIGCESVNDGPHHETLQAAVHHLVEWVATGTMPPASPDLDVVDGTLVRDEFGIATGGIRTPPVDVPLRLLTGETDEGGACRLFGATHPIDPAVLAGLHADVDAYVAAFEASAANAVAAGWLLQVDADLMIGRETLRATELLGS